MRKSSKLPNKWLKPNDDGSLSGLLIPYKLTILCRRLKVQDVGMMENWNTGIVG